MFSNCEILDNLPSNKMFKNMSTKVCMVMDTFRLSIGEAEAGDSEASLLFLACFKTALAITVYAFVESYNCRFGQDQITLKFLLASLP